MKITQNNQHGDNFANVNGENVELFQTKSVQRENSLNITVNGKEIGLDSVKDNKDAPSYKINMQREKTAIELLTNIEDMAQATNHREIVEVIEHHKVRYEKKNFLFFSWYSKIALDKIGRDIVIQTNDEIDKIYLNGKQVN